MNLDSMKYAELRSLAKELGLKANMKADKLLKAIKQHYEQEKNEEEKQGQEEDATSVQADENGGQETKDASCEEEVSVPSVFVNTRRGKGSRTKRKISESAAECDAELPPSAAEADTKVDESSAPRGAKKRKVSSTKDTDATETPDEPQTTGTEQQQQQPDAKDEAAVHGKEPKVARTGRIPRYQGSQQKSKTLKPVTPNFKKLHEAHFNKMESIDSYVQRKTKQIQTYRNSVKELKKLADKTKLQQVGGKPQVKANRTSIFSPIPKAAEDKHRQTLPSATKAPPSKPAEKTDALFRPSVLSTRRINVRFSEATHNNENKTSMVKTPARRSLCASSTPQKTTTDGAKPNNNNNKASTTTKTPGPFVFTGNTSISATPGTQKKPTFDLKASLSRPLTYKPYTGKLKPFGGENTEHNTGNASTIGSHQKNYKQHQVQTRGDRRAKHMEDRKQKKENLLGARRGLVMM